MAEKASGKAQKQGQSRPQAQAKSQTKQRQAKQDPHAGRGGGGARGGTNGAAARKAAGEQRNRPRQQRQESQNQEQQEQSQGGAGGIGETLQQHPITAAALGAGLTLLAAQGLRMAMAGNLTGAQEDEGRPSGRGFHDEGDHEGDEGEEDARGASASGEEDEEGEDQGQEGEADDGRGGFGSRMRQGGSSISRAFSGSGGAIRRGAQSGFARGRQAADQSWHTHPLVMCGLALAAGAAAGFLLPKTRQEDRLMGKAADKVTGRIKKVISESFQQGRSVAGRVVHEAISTTAREAEREGLTPDRLGKKVKRLVSHVRAAVSDAVEEE